MTSLPEEIEGLRRAMGRVKEEWDSDLDQFLSQAGQLRNVIAQHERTTEKLKTEFRVLDNAFQLISQICRVNLNELESEVKPANQKFNDKSLSATEPLAADNQTTKTTENQPQSEAKSVQSEQEVANRPIRADPVTKKIVTPPHTPIVPCFVNHRDGVSPHNINECRLFMVRYTATDRARLLVKHSRCFTCWLVGSFDGPDVHNSSECEHPRYCENCVSGSHHTVLCGARLVTKRRV